MEVVTFTLQPLSPGEKSPRYPLDTQLSVPQSWSGRGGQEKIPSLPLQGIKPRSSSPQYSHYTDCAIPAPNDTCDSTRASSYLLLADDVNTYFIVSNADNCALFQSDIYSVQNWCLDNGMKLNTGTTTIIPLTR
jgi:hypothetical protein